MFPDLVGDDTNGAFTVAELTAGAELGPPPHIHRHNDESFYILEGTFDFSLASLQAIYKPTLTSTISQQSTTNPSTQTISGGTVGTGIVAGTTTYNGGISQSLRWGGGTLVGTLNNNHLPIGKTGLLGPLNVFMA